MSSCSIDCPRVGTLSMAVFAIVFGILPRASAQVCHEGRLDGSVMYWHSTYFGDASFVGPLPSDLTLVGIDHGNIREEHGHMVGVIKTGANPVVITTRQPISEDEGALHPPLTSLPQRIILVSESGSSVVFAPLLEGPITRHVGYHASRGIDEHTRAELDLWCGSYERGVPIYVRDIGYSALQGQIIRPEERGNYFLRFGWIVLVMGAIGAFLFYRRLMAQAQIERAEALIEGRFRALEHRRDTEQPR